MRLYLVNKFAAKSNIISATCLICGEEIYPDEGPFHLNAPGPYEETVLSHIGCTEK